jgi:hypothetical protein
MSRVGLEPTNAAFERAKTVHASDREATVIGSLSYKRHVRVQPMKVPYKDTCPMYRQLKLTRVTLLRPQFHCRPLVIASMSIAPDVALSACSNFSDQN